MSRDAPVRRLSLREGGGGVAFRGPSPAATATAWPAVGASVFVAAVIGPGQASESERCRRRRPTPADWRPVYCVTETGVSSRAGSGQVGSQLTRLVSILSAVTVCPSQAEPSRAEPSTADRSLSVEEQLTAHRCPPPALCKGRALAAAVYGHSVPGAERDLRGWDRSRPRQLPPCANVPFHFLSGLLVLQAAERRLFGNVRQSHASVKYATYCMRLLHMCIFGLDIMHQSWFGDQWQVSCRHCPLTTGRRPLTTN